MKHWTILASVLIIGISIAIGVWFFVRLSTNENQTDTASDERRGFFSFFSETLGIGGDENLPATTTDAGVLDGPSFRERLRRARILPLSDSMIAGTTFTTVIKEASSTTTATTTEEFIRFVERETGHINDLSLETGNTQRVTNTTIPAIQEVLWGENGSAVALRYLADDNETIETYVAYLKTTSTSETYDLDGIFFPQNISSLSLASVGREIFYMTADQDRAVGQISSIANHDQKTIFTSPLREWVSSWKTPETIFITSKPSVLATGVSYTLTKSGEVGHVVSGSGLTVLPSPSGTRILYTIASSNTVRSFVLTRDTRQTTSLSIRTLPEKCVWRGDDSLICAVPTTIPQNIPDLWYQGAVSFNDTLWKIDVPNERYDFLYAPEETDARQTMDMIDLALSDDGTIISFMNKKDLRGWVADVSSEGEGDGDGFQQSI